MDRLDAMRALLAALDNGSLSEAARRLGQPLATLSRRVAALERDLGAVLLRRTARGLEPTPAGSAYAAAARAILEQLDEAERAAAGEYTEPRGDLVVTAPVMFGRLHVLPVVTEFLAFFAEVSVELRLNDRVARLAADQIDAALRIGALPDSSLIATRLGTVRRVTCASPAYLARHPPPATPHDLAAHEVISFESVAAPTDWRYGPPRRETAIRLRARLAVDTIDAALDAALAGAGILRANSYQVADHLRAGRLTLLLEPHEPTPRPVHLVYPAQPRLPLKLRAFADHAIPRLRDRLTAAAL